MLPEIYYDRCREFRNTLQHLRVLLNSEDEETLAPRSIKSTFDTATQIFRDILDVELSNIDPIMAAHLQSMHTEFNRLLRLLGVDIIFLQAARQSATVQQRQIQMGDRLSILLQGCDQILAMHQSD